MKVLSQLRSTMGLSHKKRLQTQHSLPLEFHPVHGSNVALTKANTTATRVHGFCNAIVFTQRPVKVNEKVFVRFEELCGQWKGAIRFGFSGTNPNNLSGKLPKYVCPDLTSRGGFWAKGLPEKFAERNGVLYYYFNKSGDVIFGINGKDKGVFFSGVDTSRPVWGLIDVYGSSTSIHLLNPRKTLNNMMQNEETEEQNLSNVSKASYMNESSHSRNSVPRLSGAFLPNCRGKNVRLNAEATTATRQDMEFCQGYVFLDSNLQPGETLVIQVEEIDNSFMGNIAFGLTNANTNTLMAERLPEDSSLLHHRKEHWQVAKDILSSPLPGDIVCFSINMDGAIVCSVNGGKERVLFYTDVSLPTRPFIDVFGTVKVIRLLGVAPAVSKIPTKSFYL